MQCIRCAQSIRSTDCLCPVCEPIVFDQWTQDTEAWTKETLDDRRKPHTM